MGSKKVTVQSPTVNAPQQRDYQAEMMGALRAQMAIQPELLAAERKYAPEWLQLQSQLAAQQLGYMSPIMERAGLTAQNTYRKTLGPAAGLLTLATNQAREGLALGGGLSAEEISAGQQAARAAMQARGLGGNQAIGAELLGNYRMAQEREDRRRQYAANVYGMAEQSAGNAYTQYATPMLSSLVGTGPQFFNPESGYQAALISGNQRAQVDIEAAKLGYAGAQASAAATRSAGKSSMFGDLGGALIGGMFKLCWVAREVYGKDNPRWLVFREWMVTKAPRWLYDIYAKHGESFAKFISDKPVLKKIVKSAMDVVVDSEIEKSTQESRT